MKWCSVICASLTSAQTFSVKKFADWHWRGATAWSHLSTLFFILLIHGAHQWQPLLSLLVGSCSLYYLCRWFYYDIWPFFLYITIFLSFYLLIFFCRSKRSQSEETWKFFFAWSSLSVCKVLLLLYLSIINLDNTAIFFRDAFAGNRLVFLILLCMLTTNLIYPLVIKKGWMIKKVAFFFSNL